MVVLVTGATGAAGSLVAKELCKAGVEVRAIVRNPDKAKLPEGCITFKGNLSDAASFAPALSGVDCLFLLLTPDADPDIIDAEGKAGVSRIVALSDGTEYEIERRLVASSVPWVSLS